MKLKTLKEYMYMTLGTVIMTAGVYFFKIPNGFATGGVSGIGTLLGKVTFLSAANWITIINILMLIVGFIVLGRATGIRTVYCSLLFSGLTELLQLTVPIKAPLTALIAVFGIGLLVCVGVCISKGVKRRRHKKGGNRR